MSEMMRLDLHVHTKYSADGMVEPKLYLKKLKNAGLDGLAITDHNEVSGTIKAHQLAKGMKNVTVIRGIEISSLSGHILAYGIKEPVLRSLTAEETIEQILDAGGVPVAAHPYRLASGLGSIVVKREEFSCVEVLNHRSPKRENIRAAQLASELGSGKTGGSDAHFIWELGSAATEFEINSGSEDDLLQELGKKRSRPVGESSTYLQGLKMYSKLVVHWLKRGFRRV